jgi:hypothetical protein
MILYFLLGSEILLVVPMESPQIKAKQKSMRCCGQATGLMAKVHGSTAGVRSPVPAPASSEEGGTQDRSSR